MYVSLGYRRGDSIIAGETRVLLASCYDAVDSFSMIAVIISNEIIAVICCLYASTDTPLATNLAIHEYSIAKV
jgi:hypothetical protein